MVSRFSRHYVSGEVYSPITTPSSSFPLERFKWHVPDKHVNPNHDIFVIIHKATGSPRCSPLFLPAVSRLVRILNIQLAASTWSAQVPPPPIESSRCGLGLGVWIVVAFAPVASFAAGGPAEPGREGKSVSAETFGWS